MAAKKKDNKPKVTKATSSAPLPSASNGKSKSKPSPPPKTSLFSCVFMAVVAFLAGVFTPPSLHVVREGVNVNPSFANDVKSPPVTGKIPPVTPLSFPLPPHVPCTSSNLDNYLHASPVPGLHVVCVDPIYLEVDGKEQPLSDSSDIGQTLHEVDSLRVTFYKGSHASPLRRRVKVRGNTNIDSGGVESIAWLDLKTQLIAELGLAPEGPTQQPWAVFTALGERIVGENDIISKEADEIGSNKHIMHSIAASGMVVVAQGGNWMWPGVREGFQRTIELAPPKNAATSKESHNITIETLSLKPLVLSIEGFLTDDECDYIAEKAGPTMKYSSVSLKDADVGRASSDWRTSQSTFLSADNDPILQDIEYRTGSLTRVPRTHQEYVQVLRYGTSEKYDSHHDYFDPSAYKSDKSTLNLIEHGKKNRFATVFWYLTDVDEGGHTVFPRAGGLPPVMSHSDCSKGLKVKPQKGKVIIFYSLDASGAMDPLSLHGACPVIGESDVKWAANKWIWNAPMGFVRD
mmetsp:Transcript_36951/g.66463  ORF Transcript_36951/g.66463 Transcript_36951/m.66463 type:complete len:517 (-) Transcript_36951:119-1669(-)|eukprot:CAMPEP_0201936872 /NCGR_PEP_ID=MMETSP0903-20130614/38293_1 /ASSEMBLY_ACC=CAM_ASM_000552 /TAXON_ID=420261 /ORGANISM="Thalassiosira antarctica, Strain CCMP982" /LENGTH=516 /DNA_ID=CAMNT_0048477667 /DNA_START=36 /DNA_END=1586 /DNA_ORIENTATION=-